MWMAMKRESGGAVPSSSKPARPWSIGRRDKTGTIEWLKDARGRVRTFADASTADAVARGFSQENR